MSVMGVDTNGNPIEAVFATVLCETLRQCNTTQLALARRMAKHSTFQIWSVPIAKPWVSAWSSGARLPNRRDVEVIADCLLLSGTERARLFAAAGQWPDEWELP